MREAGERTGFLDERLASGVARTVDADHLDCDLAVELHVVGLEHQAHAAAADALEHGEAPDLHRIRGAEHPSEHRLSQPFVLDGAEPSRLGDIGSVALGRVVELHDPP